MLASPQPETLRSLNLAPKPQTKTKPTVMAKSAERVFRQKQAAEEDLRPTGKNSRTLDQKR
jgi:hypothetical protein